MFGLKRSCIVAIFKISCPQKKSLVPTEHRSTASSVLFYSSLGTALHFDIELMRWLKHRINVIVSMKFVYKMMRALQGSRSMEHIPWDIAQQSSHCKQMSTGLMP